MKVIIIPLFLIQIGCGGLSWSLHDKYDIHMSDWYSNTDVSYSDEDVYSMIADMQLMDIIDNIGSTDNVGPTAFCCENSYAR